MSNLKSELWFDNFESANTSNSNLNVSRDTFLSYYRYLAYITNSDEDKVKSGDRLQYKGIKIICD